MSSPLSNAQQVSNAQQDLKRAVNQLNWAGDDLYQRKSTLLSSSTEEIGQAVAIEELRCLARYLNQQILAPNIDSKHYILIGHYKPIRSTNNSTVEYLEHTDKQLSEKLNKAKEQYKANLVLVHYVNPKALCKVTTQVSKVAKAVGIAVTNPHLSIPSHGKPYFDYGDAPAASVDDDTDSEWENSSDEEDKRAPAQAPSRNRPKWASSHTTAPVPRASKTTTAAPPRAPKPDAESSDDDWDETQGNTHPFHDQPTKCGKADASRQRLSDEKDKKDAPAPRKIQSRSKWASSQTTAAPAPRASKTTVPPDNDTDSDWPSSGNEEEPCPNEFGESQSFRQLLNDEKDKKEAMKTPKPNPKMGCKGPNSCTIS